TSGRPSHTAAEIRRTLTRPRETGVKVSPAGSNGLGAAWCQPACGSVIGVRPPQVPQSSLPHTPTPASTSFRSAGGPTGALGGLAVVVGRDPAPVLDDEGDADEHEAG